MSATYERTDDYVTVISDAGRQRLAAEQRDKQAEIRIWTLGASIAAIAGLVLKQILGS
jgi:hypothetical protein